jgi:hypothetical protein
MGAQSPFCCGLGIARGGDDGAPKNAQQEVQAPAKKESKAPSAAARTPPVQKDRKAITAARTPSAQKEVQGFMLLILFFAWDSRDVSTAHTKPSPTPQGDGDPEERAVARASAHPASAGDDSGGGGGGAVAGDSLTKPLPPGPDGDKFLYERWEMLKKLHKRVKEALTTGKPRLAGLHFRSNIFEDFGKPVGYGDTMADKKKFWHDFRHVVRFGETGNQRKNPATGKKEKWICFDSDLNQLFALEYAVAGVATPQQ